MIRKCPYCAEKILIDAKKCKHCGEWLKISTEDKSKDKNQFIKYYILWLGSIVTFFGSFAFSTAFKSPQIDNFSLILVGLSSIIGTGAFVKLLWIVKSESANRIKRAGVIIFTILVFFAVILSDLPFVKGDLPNETGLRKTIDKISRLSGENGARSFYNNYLYSEEKTMTEEEYVKGFLENEKANPYIKMDIQSIKIEGNLGIVDRTINTCTDSSCRNFIPASFYRAYKYYVFENGKWYASRVSSCPRTKPYEMEPEFSRALSLIVQRFQGQDDQMFKEILNCVNIEYAKSDLEMNEAEGIFTFIAGQDPLKLEIKVSPKYKFTDDLLTAYLISHELEHAETYVLEWGIGKKIGCFENEANAFNRQIQFLKNLNSEEINSLDGRLSKGGSQELMNVWNTTRSIAQNKGSTGYEKALNYVKSHPFYQKECSGI